MASRTWGLKLKIMYWLYTAVVRPVLVYGCHVWAAALDKQTVCTRLERLQRLACITITGAFPSTPTAAMEALLNLPPIDIFLRSQAYAAFHRLKCAGKWKPWSNNPRTIKYTTHMEVCQESSSIIGPLNWINDKCKTHMLFNRRFGVSIPSRETWESDTAYPSDSGVFHCFTDGSRMDTGTGAAYVIYTEGKKMVQDIFPLGKYSTVFQAEVFFLQYFAEKYCKSSICLAIFELQ